MRLLLIHDRAADGGYPVDSDLHQMTDDGCPLVPDPARWADAAWRDQPGELGTFDGRPALADLTRLPALVVDTRRSRLLRCTDCGRTEAYSPERLVALYGSSGWPECCGRVMGYSALPPPGRQGPDSDAVASQPRTSERLRYLDQAGGDRVER